MDLAGVQGAEACGPGSAGSRVLASSFHVRTQESSLRKAGEAEGSPGSLSCPLRSEPRQGLPTASPHGRAAPPKRGCPPPISPPRPGLRLWAREFFSLQTPPNLQPAHLKDHLVSCSEAQAHARLEEDYADQKGEGDTRRLGLPETACRSRPLSPPCCATAVLTLSGSRPPEMISAWRGGSALRGRSEGCSGLG